MIKYISWLQQLYSFEFQLFPEKEKWFTYLNLMTLSLCLFLWLCRDSLMASLLDGVRASGNRDVCVKMASTQRGQRWGLLSMPVDEEVESLHLKFLAAPPSM